MIQVRINPVFVMVIATIASLLFCYLVSDAEHAGLVKAAYIFATVLTGGWISVAMVFTGRALVSNKSWSTPADYNVWFAVICAIACPAGVAVMLDITTFANSAAETSASGLAGGLVGIAMAFAKKGPGEGE